MHNLENVNWKLPEGKYIPRQNIKTYRGDLQREKEILSQLLITNYHRIPITLSKIKVSEIDMAVSRNIIHFH